MYAFFSKRLFELFQNMIFFLKVIEKLKIQLNDTDYLTPPLEDVDDQYGFRTDKLKKIIEYWRGPYLDKWYSEREYYIGKFPQYKTKIQG